MGRGRSGDKMGGTGGTMYTHMGGGIVPCACAHEHACRHAMYMHTSIWELENMDQLGDIFCKLFLFQCAKCTNDDHVTHRRMHAHTHLYKRLVRMPHANMESFPQLQ